MGTHMDCILLRGTGRLGDECVSTSHPKTVAHEAVLQFFSTSADPLRNPSPPMYKPMPQLTMPTKTSRKRYFMTDSLTANSDNPELQMDRLENVSMATLSTNVHWFLLAIPSSEGHGQALWTDVKKGLSPLTFNQDINVNSFGEFRFFWFLSFRDFTLEVCHDQKASAKADIY